MPASSYGRVKCINNSLYTIPIQFELPASEWLSGCWGHFAFSKKSISNLSVVEKNSVVWPGSLRIVKQTTGVNQWSTVYRFSFRLIFTAYVEATVIVVRIESIAISCLSLLRFLLEFWELSVHWLWCDREAVPTDGSRYRGFTLMLINLHIFQSDRT